MGGVCQLCRVEPATWWHAWSWLPTRWPKAGAHTSLLCDGCAAVERRNDPDQGPDYTCCYLPLINPRANPEHDIAVEVALHAIARLLRLLHDDAWRAEAWRVYRAREGRAA